MVYKFLYLPLELSAEIIEGNFFNRFAVRTKRIPFEWQVSNKNTNIYAIEKSILHFEW